MGRRGQAILGVLMCVCLWPASANAAVTCSFDAVSGEVSIEMLDAGDSVTLEAGPLGEISAFAGGPDLCLAEGPTLANAEHITVAQPGADQAGSLAIDVSRPFTGGLGPEPAGPEIEITVDLGTGADTASVRSEPSIGEWHVGALPGFSAALNLNPRDETGQLDGDDVTLNNVGFLTLERPDFSTPNPTDIQPNLIDASGTSEFTGPLQIPLAIAGWEGPDTVIASAAGAQLAGGAGDDLLKAGGGPDRLFGSAGTDTMDYSRGGAGVSLDLGRDGQDQDTGGSGLDMVSGVENLIGSPFPDNLKGTTGANRIEPGAGADTVSALAGPDFIPAIDGTRDVVDCGPDADAAQADARGGRPVDLLLGCESSAFYDPAPPDVTSPVTTFTKVPGKKLKRPKAKFSFVSNEAGVTFKCALDRQLFKSCRSPEKLRKLKVGKHKLLIRGTDRAGNIETKPAVARFRVLRRGGGTGD